MISYVDVTEEDAKKGMKQLGADDWFIDVMLELFRITRAGYISQSTVYLLSIEILWTGVLMWRQYTLECERWKVIMSEMIDDLLILGFNFRRDQLEALRGAIIIAPS